MIATVEDKEVLDFLVHGQQDYSWFMANALDVNPRHLWSKMREVNDSVRDNERTAVGAGHGVSKTYVAGRIALAFLYCYYPSTVVTMAPSGHQVKNLLWRDQDGTLQRESTIRRQAHNYHAGPSARNRPDMVCNGHINYPGHYHAGGDEGAGYS